MPPRILLVSQAPKKYKLYVNTLPPIGILGIAAYLEKNNIPVDVVDCNVEPEKKIDSSNYDIVGYSINMANITSSLESIRYVKIQNPKVKIIVGGPSCISYPQYFTRDETIDAVCTGEGEEALLEFIKKESFIDGKQIAGLHTKTKEGYFVYGGDRRYITSLDTLPFPALNKVNLRKYNVPMRKRSPISRIVTSRGCPFRCIFCFHSMGYEWRARSYENVVDEIEWQVKELGVREICISDDNFSLDAHRAEQIFDLMLSRNIKVNLQFVNGIRIDFLNPGLLNKMFQAGVWLIALAPETGSPNVMKEIKKNVDLAKFKHVVQWCKEIGINTYAFFMIGFPFESMQDIQKTAAFIKDLDTDFIQLARVVPFPATPLYEMVGNNHNSAFGQEQGCFFGIPNFKPLGIADKEIAQLIKQIHKDFYLNPRRMIRLMKILPLHRLVELFIYSARTRNI